MRARAILSHDAPFRAAAKAASFSHIYVPSILVAFPIPKAQGGRVCCYVIPPFLWVLSLVNTGNVMWKLAYLFKTKQPALHFAICRGFVARNPIEHVPVDVPDVGVALLFSDVEFDLKAL